MRLLMAMKRLNRRFDRWSAGTADKMVAAIDNADERRKRDNKRHIGVWDLLAKKRGGERQSGKRT